MVVNRLLNNVFHDFLKECKPVTSSHKRVKPKRNQIFYSKEEIFNVIHGQCVVCGNFSEKSKLHWIKTFECGLCCYNACCETCVQNL